MLNRTALFKGVFVGGLVAWACGSDPAAPSPPASASGKAGKGGSAGNSPRGGTSAGGAGQGGRGGKGGGTGGKAASGGDSGSTDDGGSPPDMNAGMGGDAAGGTGGSAAGEAGSSSTGCSDNDDCPGERCNTSTHSCVECLPGSDDDCPTDEYCDGGDFTCKSGCKDAASCTTGLCKSDHTCAECNPSGTDTCATGSYCGSDGDCVQGCKADGSGCASGVCLSTHDCSSCITDAECTDGNVCSTGTCMANCGTENACPGTATCCTDRCAELSHDYLNCLACDNACEADQFCGNTGCLTATIATVCASDTATFLLDGLSVDEATVPIVRDAFVATCSPPTTPETVNQASAGTIHATTGRPVVGSGNLQVVVGGTYGQKLMSYLESSGVTAVYNSYVGTTAQFNVRDGSSSTVVVTAPESVLTESHSYFVIETVVDPTTGTLTLAMYGFTSPGTVAAAWYFVNEMLPAPGSFDKSYYVYEWTDGDADQLPSAADTFTLVVSGP